MTDTYQVRRATLADSSTLAQLGARTFISSFSHLYEADDLRSFLTKHHSTAAYQALVNAGDYGVWLAYAVGGPPMAFAVAGPCTLPVEDLPPRAGEIKRLYVDRAYQSVGVGQLLMRKMLSWLAAQNYAPLYLSVYAHNPGAQRFYQRYGFEKILEYEFAVGEHRDPEFIFYRS